MSNTTAQFSIGQVITHKRYGYQGVIVDVDQHFAQTDDWYKLMVRGDPDKAQPWYYILVDGTTYKTYVAESFLSLADQTKEIEHPELSKHVKRSDTHYRGNARLN